MPYEKEYVTGFFPVYWHCYMIKKQKEVVATMSEPQMIAYSFLETWKRIGAGHPKGADLYKSEWIDGEQDLLVVDIYTRPLGRRPVISPSKGEVDQAIRFFQEAAYDVGGQRKGAHIVAPDEENALFERFLGNEARVLLQQLSAGLVTDSVLLRNSSA